MTFYRCFDRLLGSWIINEFLKFLLGCFLQRIYAHLLFPACLFVFNYKLLLYGNFFFFGIDLPWLFPGTSVENTRICTSRSYCKQNHLIHLKRICRFVITVSNWWQLPSFIWKGVSRVCPLFVVFLGKKIFFCVFYCKKYAWKLNCNFFSSNLGTWKTIGCVEYHNLQTPSCFWGVYK